MSLLGQIRNAVSIVRNGISLIPGLTMVASGAIPANGQVSFVRLNSTTKIAATLTKPKIGHILIITQIDAGTAGHTVTLASGTWDGTNDVATFNAKYETLILFGVTADRYVVVENIGSVAFS